MPTRRGPVPGRPVTLISPPRPWAIWSTPRRSAYGPSWPKPEMRGVDEPGFTAAHRVGSTPRRYFTPGAMFSTTTSAPLGQAAEHLQSAPVVRSTPMARLLRWRFWKSDPSAPASDRPRRREGSTRDDVGAPVGELPHARRPGARDVRSTTRMPASGPADAPDGGARRSRRRAAHTVGASASARARERGRGGEEPLQHLVDGPAADRVGAVEVGLPSDPGAAADRLERDLGVVVAHRETPRAPRRRGVGAPRTRRPPRCATRRPRR